jgi:hypothetical protein
MYKHGSCRFPSVPFVTGCRLVIHFFSYLEAIPRLSISSMLHRLVILHISVLCNNVKMFVIHEAVGNIDVQLGGLQATRASHWARLPTRQLQTWLIGQLGDESRASSTSIRLDFKPFLSALLYRITLPDWTSVVIFIFKVDLVVNLSPDSGAKKYVGK